MPEVVLDQAVPDFAITATGGQTIRLSELQGRYVVLYFYPKDNTPGCTTEAQDFRDHHALFEALDAVILGVSRDDLKSHENFSRQQQLPFPLLADTDEALCQLFQVIKPKNMYGKQVMGIERSTFLIDRQGILRREWRKVKVPGHIAEVLQALRELAA